MLKALTWFAPLLILYPYYAYAADDSTSRLWEIGVAGVSGYFPDYPAADRTSFHFLPAPSIHYRGKTFRIDEKDGARARLINDPNFNLDISIAGSFPASSSNPARAGMPNLDYSAEIGPRAVYFFYNEKDYGRFGFNVPVRQVFATNFANLYQVGFVSEPTFFLMPTIGPVTPVQLQYASQQTLLIKALRITFIEWTPPMPRRNARPMRQKLAT